MAGEFLTGTPYKIEDVVLVGVFYSNCSLLTFINIFIRAGPQTLRTYGAVRQCMIAHQLNEI